MSSSAPPEPPPVDSDGQIISDIPWKFLDSEPGAASAGELRGH